MEGYSVTLHTDIKTDQQQDIKWYFNNTRIAQINGDSSYTCTDVKCNEDTERFRNRLELDYQTGSLTIKNTKKTDSGNYSLDIFSNVNHVVKIFSVSVYGKSLFKPRYSILDHFIVFITVLTCSFSFTFLFLHL